jgi:hypothetical protein
MGGHHPAADAAPSSGHYPPTLITIFRHTLSSSGALVPWRTYRRFTVTVEVNGRRSLQLRSPALICPAAVGGRADQRDGYLAAPAMNAATM